MKKALLFIALSTCYISNAQKTCETPEESLIDLNSITKCSINSSAKSKDKKSRQISVKVSASKKRYLKKRVVNKKTAVANLNQLSTSGVTDTNHSSEISNTLSLKKENKPNDIIAHLSNSLSAEEIKKASKFNAVEKLPLFTACENVKDKESLDCFNTEMIKHIQKHFRYPETALINKTQGDVWVRFIIDTNGNVTNIKALGTENAEILDQEAIRVVSKLPKFTPAIKDRKKTSVKYGFPITFSLEE